MPGTRIYRGVAPEQRTARRRAALVEAGLQLIGTQGYDAVTVKTVCAQAALTERYFYESFRDRGDLLLGVYEHVIELVTRASLEAALAAPPLLEERVRAGLEAFVRALAEDPRRARIQLLEVVGRSPALETRRRQAMHAFADFIAHQAQSLLGPAAATGERRRLESLALVGATHELVVEWTQGYARVSESELVDVLVDMYLATARISRQ